MENTEELSAEDRTFLEWWPNCPVPDCEHKVCMWAGENLCHPHTLNKIGRAEIERRYRQTHESLPTEVR